MILGLILQVSKLYFEKMIMFLQVNNKLKAQLKLKADLWSLEVLMMNLQMTRTKVKIEHGTSKKHGKLCLTIQSPIGRQL